MSDALEVVREAGDRRGHGFEQGLGRRAHVEGGGEPLQALLIVLEEHGLFGREVAVERALGHADFPRDLCHGDVVEAPFHELGQCDFAQRIARRPPAQFVAVGDSLHHDGEATVLNRLCQY